MPLHYITVGKGICKLNATCTCNLRILLDLAFIYILWETISIVCFLGAIILMDCILILKVRRQPPPSDCNDTPAMPGYRHYCTPKTTRLASGSKEASADGEK